MEILNRFLKKRLSYHNAGEENPALSDIGDLEVISRLFNIVYAGFNLSSYKDFSMGNGITITALEEQRIGRIQKYISLIRQARDLDRNSILKALRTEREPEEQSLPISMAVRFTRNILRMDGISEDNPLFHQLQEEVLEDLLWRSGNDIRDSENYLEVLDAEGLERQYLERSIRYLRMLIEERESCTYNLEEFPEDPVRLFARDLAFKILISEKTPYGINFSEVLEAKIIDLLVEAALKEDSI